MPFCIPKYQIDIIKQAMKSGEISPAKLNSMTSAERNEFFARYVAPDNAAKINAKFEATLLLKNQKRGMVNWAKSITGISEKTRGDMISRINKMDEILTPENEDAFLADLAAHKLGVTVTAEEAANIAELARIASVNKRNMEAGPRRSRDEADIWNGTEGEREYGRSAIAFKEYVDGLKAESRRITREELKSNPVVGAGRLTKELAAAWKGIKATLDQSYILRQGWKILSSSPTRWLDTTKAGMKAALGAYKGEDVLGEMDALIVSHPDYADMVKDGLAITTIEEEFPGSDIIEKIPGFKHLHLASESSFKLAIYKARIEAYLALGRLKRQSLANSIRVYKGKTNVWTYAIEGKLSKREFKSEQEAFDAAIEKAWNTSIAGNGYAVYANTIGSRGDIGKLERLGDTINLAFFSLRKLKSDFDFLTAHAFRRLAPAEGKQQLDPIAQKEAVKDVIKAISVTAAALTLAGAMGADIEDDPTSSDFGKARVGNTTFDLTGGMGSLAVLAARQAKGSLKTVGGDVLPLSGPKARLKRTDMIWNYIENKFSPPVSFLKMMAEGQTFEGEEIRWYDIATELGVPLSVDAVIEALKDPKSANLLLIMLAEQAGVSANTFKPRKSSGRKRRARGGAG